ncbi:LysR family transcriptional regulator [Salinicola corii]|uniref:LysR family transcriptional regulator n=1 Tax=Salinicola corii TaxID=2606937 RepID=A0A640WGS4_9GAMM|nr:LysR substrate-binding domain-containing protein [Salinicola corii]KAA0019613.1 LysR family transcriptional regulator [Salinicola corii]
MFHQRQLQAFVRTAELASFTRAAKEIHLSQPALSYLIRKLEGELGIALFARNTRTVVLTEGGALFLGHARRILADMSLALDDTRNVRELEQGKFTVAGLPSVASSLLPRTIAAFRKRHPKVTVVLRDGLADQVHQWVSRGEVDMGLGSPLQRDRELDFQPLFHDDLLLITPPRVVRRSESPWYGLDQMPYIAMTPGSSARHYADLAMEHAGRQVAPTWEVSFMSSAIAMVRAKLGYALLPASSVDVFNLDDITRLPVNMREPREIGILRRKPLHASPALEAFLRQLRKQIPSTDDPAPDENGSASPA